jgi:hypothetical protein
MAFTPSFRALSSLIAVSYLLSSNMAQAQTATCPLQGSKLADLRASAERLQQRISLGPECEKESADVQALGLSVKTSIDQLYSIEAEQRKKNQEAAAKKSSLTDEQLNEAAEKEAGAAVGRDKLKASVDAVNALGSQLRALSDSRCGRAILSNLDYISAFVETVNGLTPSMLLFASAAAAPTILAGSVITSLAKSVILFFRAGNGVDMSKPAQRKYFEETVCAFYTYDRMYQGVHNRPGALEESSRRLIKAKGELEALKQKATPSIAEQFAAYIAAEKTLAEDIASMRGTEKLINDLGNSDSVRCGVVRSVIKSKYSDKVVTNLDVLLKENETKGQSTTMDRSLLETYLTLSKEENFQASNTDDSLKRCGAMASDWIKATQYVLNRTSAELNAPHRLESAYRDQRAHQKLVADKEGEVKREDEYNKWLQSSTQDRSDAINLTEISEGQRDAKEALFGSKQRYFLGIFKASSRGPTESWLEHKTIITKVTMNIFKPAFRGVNDRWLNSTPTPGAKEQACGETETVRLQWLDAAAHVEAIDVMCDTFKFHFQGENYENLHKVCVGTSFDKKQQAWKKPFRFQTRELVENEKPNMLKIDLWQRAVGCKRPI